jgi:hypothetical protein
MSIALGPITPVLRIFSLEKTQEYGRPVLQSDPFTEPNS